MCHSWEELEERGQQSWLSCPCLRRAGRQSGFNLPGAPLARACASPTDPWGPSPVIPGSAVAPPTLGPPQDGCPRAQGLRAPGSSPRRKAVDRPACSAAAWATQPGVH